MRKNCNAVDFAAIQEHLDFLDAKAKVFAFASYTEKGRESESSISERMFGTLKQYTKQMQQYQNTYGALYVNVSAIKPGNSATKDDIDYVRALFIDLDDPGSTLDDVFACPLPVHRIVETSPGKHQCYWLVNGLTVEEAEGFTRWLVQKFSADKGVWDASRVFRLPGSWHQKGDPFQVRVVHTLKTARAYTIQDIDAAGVQWTPQRTRAKATDYIPPSDVDVDKLVMLVNGSDEACLDVWNAERDDFGVQGLDGSAYHMAIASMIKKCRLPIEVFDVYLRAWVNRHPAGDRQCKVDRPGYIAMTWAKNTMGVALRRGETWEGWRARREGVMALFDKDVVADDGEPDVGGIEEFLRGCSEDALAMRAANHFKGNLRLINDTGQWMLWDGRKWVSDRTQEVERNLRGFLRGLVIDATTYAKDLNDTAKQKEGDAAKVVTALAGKLHTLANRLGKTKTMTDVKRQLTSEFRSGAEIVSSADMWDTHNELLGTSAGVVNLKTGELLEDGRRFFCSKATLTGPSNDAPELWLKTIGEIFDGDAETLDFMHRFFGYALTGYNREECFLFCYGAGRNGKGVLINTIADVLGEYARSVDAELFTTGHTGQHKTRIATLQGVRLVVSSEVPDGATWNLQQIKLLTGGDTLQANFMRKDLFYFKPNLSLVISANDRPTMRNVDVAIKQRLRFVPFPQSFEGRENVTLKENLRAEHPQILGWLIQGAKKYLADGLTYPNSIRAVTDSYLDEANVIKNWFGDTIWSDEDTEPSVEESYFTALDLMAHYARYAKAMSANTIGKHAFLDYLRSQGLTDHRKRFKYRYRGTVTVWGPFNDIKSDR